jgi:hypothetical protein
MNWAEDNKHKRYWVSTVTFYLTFTFPSYKLHFAICLPYKQYIPVVVIVN